MNPEDLDRLLSNQEDIVPSSGFVANVMDAVERAASTPPPIPFPWKYALPGLTACLIALAALAFLALRSPAPRAAPALAAAIEGLRAIGAGWIAVALLVSAASIFFPMRAVGSRA
jgi:hypothetical protein